MKFIVKKEKLIKNYLVLSFSMISIIGSLAIYYPNTTLSSIEIRNVLRFLIYLVTLSSFIIIFLKRFKLNLGVFIPFFYVMIYYFDSYKVIRFPLLLLLQLVSFMLLRIEEKYEIYNIIRKYIILSSLIGILCFILYFFKLSKFYTMIPYYNQVEDTYYINFSISYLCVGKNNIARLCGLFNEPGFFGTIIAFILCVEILDNKKWSNVILFIAGCLTQSLAFFIILIIYFILLNYKKPYIIILLLIFYLFILPHIEVNNLQLNSLINRLTLKSGELVGNNRSNNVIDNLVKKIFFSEKLFFGYGRGYTQYFNDLKQMSGFSTYKSYIIDYGLLGFFIIYFPLFLYSLNKNKKNRIGLFYIMCFFLSIYQRPDIYTVLFFAILFGGIEAIKLKKNN